MMREKVFIRGKSLTCALGESLDKIISCMQHGKFNMDHLPLTLTHSDYTRPYYRIHRDRHGHKENSQEYFYGILFDTIHRAIVDAKLEADEIEDLAIFFGSTSIDIPIYERYYEECDSATPHILSQVISGYGNIADEVARHFNIRGPSYTFMTACTSSANALMYAADKIKKHDINKALVIGYDLFNNIGFYGFESLKLISPSAYKPFDKNREGVIMGEGCGVVILDKEKYTNQDFCYLGGANMCDIFNITTHNIEGGEIADVIFQAVKDAELQPDDIDAVKAHGTGSYQNDKTEANAIKKVFGEKIPYITGIKPFVGHTVGASGVIEAILMTESVKTGFLPPTLGFEQIDDELNLIPLQQAIQMTQGNIMLNYFGFGGNCTSLIVSNKGT